MNIYIPNPFRKKKPLETTRKQPETLIMAIDHHMNRHSGWTVKICVVDAKKLKPFPILTTTVAEFAPVCADVEAYIREEFGAGEFRIEIYEPTGQIAAKYSVPVGGPKAYRQPGVGGTDKGGTGEGTLTGQLAAFAQFATLMKTIMPETPPPDTTNKELLLKLVDDRLSPAASPSDEFMHQWMTVKINNEMSEKENFMGTMRDAAEMVQLFGPKIAPEDTTSAMIQAIPGVIQGLAMMRGGSAPPAASGVAALAPAALPAGNGGVDMNALQTLAMSLPEDVINQFPADQQNAILQLRAAGAPGGASVLPRPGAVAGAPGVQSEVPTGGEVGVSPPSPTPSPAGSGAYHQAADRTPPSVAEIGFCPR